jgi:hypothetical protein
MRLPLNTEKERNHGEDSPLRRHQFKGWRQRSGAAGVLRRCFGIRANCPISRGDKDREQPSSEGAVFSYTAIADAFTAISPDLPAEGEPDNERYSNDGQNDGYERTSAPCRTPTYVGVGVPPPRRPSSAVGLTDAHAAILVILQCSARFPGRVGC